MLIFFKVVHLDVQHIYSCEFFMGGRTSETSLLTECKVALLHFFWYSLNVLFRKQEKMDQGLMRMEGAALVQSYVSSKCADRKYGELVVICQDQISMSKYHQFILYS